MVSILGGIPCTLFKINTFNICVFKLGPFIMPSLNSSAVKIHLCIKSVKDGASRVSMFEKL